MLSNNIVLEVKGIGKIFNSYEEGSVSNSEATIRKIISLKDINFQLKQGDILGIIGNNGAGKSTLLKIISGLLKPDEGIVTYRGKLSSILDIGSGFHPDLTGLDNVHMVARLMGYSKKEIDGVIEDIFDFSELKLYKYTPIKHYSSGMFMRLAFSLYTTLKSNVLIIDEVLSVGDMNFREKSAARIKEIASLGKTIILASHEMRTIQTLCTHGLFLEKGINKGFDKIQNIIDKYVDGNDVILTQGTLTASSPLKDRAKGEVNLSLPTRMVGNENLNPVNPKILLIEAFVKAVNKPVGEEMFMDDELEIVFIYEKLIKVPVILSAIIADRFGSNLMNLSSYRIGLEEMFVDTTQAGRYEQKVKVPKSLLNQGTYSISFFVSDTTRQNVRSFEKILYFRISQSKIELKGVNYEGNLSCPFFPIANWQTTRHLDD